MLENIEEAQNVGELLRNTRLKKGKTLGDVSKDLCIRKFYLEAIENMDSKNLPQMPYGLGFVRSYAEYLGLNSARIVQAYRQVAYAEPDDDFQENNEDAPADEYAGPSLRHVLIGLLGVAAIFAVWSGISSYTQSKAETEVKEIAENDVVPEPVIIEENEPALAEIEIEDAEPEKNAEPVAENTEENSAEPVPAQTEKASAENEVAAAPEPTPVEAAEPVSATPTKIHISFAGPSWLELKQGEKVLLSGIYSKGFKYDVPNEAGIVVSVGRYYNVDFYVDGKLTKIASALKQTNISLDKYILPEQKQE